jgi:PncC family amidohydrolase
VPGSSRVFIGGVIAYSNEMKKTLLDVPEEILGSKGAVSEEAALAMAQGVVNATGSDCGISVTGVAGPGGGSPEKPAGTVWFAVASPLGGLSRSYLFQGEREEVREKSVQTALELVLEVFMRGHK